MTIGQLLAQHGIGPTQCFRCANLKVLRGLANLLRGMGIDEATFIRANPNLWKSSDGELEFCGPCGYNMTSLYQTTMRILCSRF